MDNYFVFIAKILLLKMQIKIIELIDVFLLVFKQYYSLFNQFINK
jgi:hypothetical protein